MRRLSALCMAALIWGSSACSASPPQPPPSPPLPLTSEEVQSLIRIDQLSEWVGYPADLSTGLCVELNYPGSWPAAGLQGISQRTENMLQQTLEACNTPANDTRLVAQIREIIQSQVLRLAQPHNDMSQCRKVAAQVVSVEKCLVFALGRPVSPAERKLLNLKASAN